MASRISPNTPVCVAHDTVSSDATQPIVKLARQDTGSSTGSARRPPNGNWAFNISGVCSRCHHHHSSIQVHVKISDDSTQFGDVRCKKCQGLWVAFGKTNATRLSLLSTISMEPDALELEFRSTLDQIIRSTMPIAALSSSLAVIPESAGPSRGTSVRSATRSNIRNRAAATINDASSNADEPEGCHGALEGDHYEQSNDKKLSKLSKHTLTKGRKVLIHVQHKAKVGLSRFQNFPSGLRRLFSKESKGYRSHQQEPTRPPPHVSPTMVVSPSLPEEEPEMQAEDDTNVDMDALDVCASSATAADALAALKAFNSQALKNLPPKQRFSWGRRQLTHFKARHSTAVGISAKVNTESLTDRNGTQLARDYLLDRPQSLAYIGHAFDIHDNSSIYRRPFSVSETNLSDADTIFDGMSISSLPRHLLNEGIHRNQHRSLSPRPLSMQSIPQDWTPYHRNTTEFRRSIDSTVTGGVRSITHNRLSFVSMNRASSVYAAEVPSSQAQFGIDEQINGPLGSQRPRSHSPSPLNPGVDTAQE